MTELAEDFIDLLVCLTAAESEFLLVGGYAMNAYGVVRATEDLDVFVSPHPENLERVLAGMTRFGLPPGLVLEALLPEGRDVPTGFRFGFPPVAIGLLTALTAVSFEEAQAHQTVLHLPRVAVPVIGREALRRNKLSSGRTKDRADVEALDRVARD